MVRLLSIFIMVLMQHMEMLPKQVQVLMISSAVVLEGFKKLILRETTISTKTVISGGLLSHIQEPDPENYVT